MVNKILTPQNSDIRTRLKEILEGVEVPAVESADLLVPNKWIVFTEEPESLVTRGESIDVLRSPKDSVELSSGVAEEQINAWIIEKKPNNPTKNQPLARENANSMRAGLERGLGKVKVSHTFILGCIQALSKGAVRHATECDTVRRRFNELEKLGFDVEKSRFVESHTGLTETIHYKEKFGVSWALVSEFEITVFVYETYN